MCNFVIGLVTPLMLSAITYGTYLFFAAFCLLALAFVYFGVPETQGKMLEDMDLVFGDKEAYEEKERVKGVEARLRGVDVRGRVEKGEVEHLEV